MTLTWTATPSRWMDNAKATTAKVGDLTLTVWRRRHRLGNRGRRYYVIDHTVTLHGPSGYLGSVELPDLSWKDARMAAEQVASNYRSTGLLAR